MSVNAFRERNRQRYAEHNRRAVYQHTGAHVDDARREFSEAHQNLTDKLNKLNHEIDVTEAHLAQDFLDYVARMDFSEVKQNATADIRPTAKPRHGKAAEEVERRSDEAEQLAGDHGGRRADGPAEEHVAQQPAADGDGATTESS